MDIKGECFMELDLMADIIIKVLECPELCGAIREILESEIPLQSSQAERSESSE